MLNFPNACRSYDAKADHVRFWGYDRVMEVAFFLDAGALRMLNPKMPREAAGYLAGFDAALDRIHDVAQKVHARARKGTYSHLLSASDF